jgi:DNA polymerase
VKCRPPDNRDPHPDEIAACQPFLDRQIELIDPKLIVTLGRFSMARWFSGTTISRVHGQPKQVDGRYVVPMYHPAAALHRGSLRAEIMADFAQLPELLERALGDQSTPQSQLG